MNAKSLLLLVSVAVAAQAVRPMESISMNYTKVSFATDEPGAKGTEHRRYDVAFARDHGRLEEEIQATVRASDGQGGEQRIVLRAQGCGASASSPKDHIEVLSYSWGSGSVVHVEPMGDGKRRLRIASAESHGCVLVGMLLPAVQRVPPARSSPRPPARVR